MAKLITIKGAANGGIPGEPLSQGDMVVTEDGEWMQFRSYSSSGWFGYFMSEGTRSSFKLPLAGLRYQPK